MERGGEGEGRKAGEGQLARAEHPELEGERTTHAFSSSTQWRDQGPPARDMPINPLPRWDKQSPDSCDSACPSPLNLPQPPPHTLGHLSAWAHLLCLQIYVKFLIIVSSFPSPKLFFTCWQQIHVFFPKSPTLIRVFPCSKFS